MLSNYPALRPSLLLDFANAAAVDPRVTFTRHSRATAFDARGQLRTFDANVPRIEYDPATRACLGLLIEEQRTNICLHSRDLTQAAWVKTGATAARTQTGIDGAANTATRITATSGNGTVLQSITRASGAHTTSAYVRRAVGTGIVEMTQNGGSTWTTITVPAAWGRVSVPSATLANPTVGFRLQTGGDAIDVDFVACESGAFPTSPIQTDAVEVTRAADVALLTGESFSSWWNSAQGTLVAEASISGYTLPATQFPIIASANDGSANNVIELGYTTSSLASLVVRSGNVEQAGLYPASSAAVRAVAAAYNVNDFAVCVNAGPVATDTSGSVPLVDRLRLGERNATGSSSICLNGHFRRLAYYPRRLTNAELQAITTG